MNCTPYWKAKLATLLLSLCVSNAGLAQEKQPAPQDPTALATLLEQLTKTDAKAWLARKNAMLAARSLAQKGAQTLRAQAKAKHAEADKQTARAKKLAAESEQLKGIRGLGSSPWRQWQQRLPHRRGRRRAAAPRGLPSAHPAV